MANIKVFIVCFSAIGRILIKVFLYPLLCTEKVVNEIFLNICLNVYQGCTKGNKPLNRIRTHKDFQLHCGQAAAKPAARTPSTGPQDSAILQC